MALRGHLGRPEVIPLILASTSPQRRAILEQLRIPFDVVAPDFEEVDGTSPLERAAGKARSVDGGDRPVLGVDTEVLFEGALLGKPADETEAEQMLEALAGRTHEVVSGSLPAHAGVGGAARGGDARHVPHADARATSRTTSRRASGRDARAATRSRDLAPASSSGSKATS